MKLCGSLVVLGMLAFGGTCVFGVDISTCASQSKMAASLHACYTSRGLPFDSMEMSDLVAICQNKTVNVDALRCMLKLTRDCMVIAGQGAGKAVDPGNAEDMINYLCNNTANINLPCYTSQSAAMTTCINNKMSNLPTGTTDVCKPYGFSVECAGEVYSRCGQQTKDIIVTLEETYMIPVACDATHSVASAALLVIAGALGRLLLL